MKKENENYKELQMAKLAKFFKNFLINTWWRTSW
jgi:hypothetical protein